MLSGNLPFCFALNKIFIGREEVNCQCFKEIYRCWIPDYEKYFSTWQMNKNIIWLF